MRDPETSITWPVQALWVLSMSLVAWLSLTPRIEVPLHFSGADKVAHCLAYAWLAILPFFGCGRMRSAFTGSLLMVPLGMGLEFAQNYVPGRDFSVLDMVANTTGVALGIFAALCVKKKRLRSQAATGWSGSNPRDTLSVPRSRISG